MNSDHINAVDLSINQRIENRTANCDWPGFSSLLASLFCFSLVAATSQAALLVDEDFEGGLSAWTPTGTWGTATSALGSPTHSVTDSPGAYYSSGTDSSLTLLAGINLSGTSAPVLSFLHEYDLEADYDFALVETSTNGGSSWNTLATYTGSASGQREQLDLSSLAGQSSVLLRFRLTSDASVVKDGWSIDDIALGEEPAAIVLNSPVAIERNSVELSWTAYSGSDFSEYQILRSTGTVFDWRTAHVVDEITNSSTTAYSDITVAPKTTYTYRILVLTTDRLHSLSNEMSATTLAGMDYPFLDNGEGGGSVWVADTPWALSDEQSRSGSMAWSDSPAANYGDGIATQSLTLSAPLDLSAAQHPVWMFYYRADLLSGDIGFAEVSTNNGSSWDTLGTVSSNENTSDWLPVRIPLDDYRSVNILLRFRLTTNASGNADGIHLDDISVAEAPTALPTPAISNLDSHSVTLSWGASAHSQLDHYAIHRSQGTSVDFSDTLVAEIPKEDPLTYSDSELYLNTDYAYRVYAVTKYGTYSDESVSPALIHTLSQPAPFNEGFEGSSIAWTFGSNNAAVSRWSISNKDNYSGGNCLTDSPDSSYESSSDTYAETAVDLRETEWPVLTFWDRFDLNTGDWFRLEISSDGGPTEHLYGARETSRNEWRQQKIDLSRWKGLANVRLRFRLITDGGSTPADGWFIDELTVAENPDRSTPVTLPFTEGFEANLDQWFPAGWHLEDDTIAIDGTRSIQNIDGTKMGNDTMHTLTLGQPIILPANSNVQVTYWIRGQLSYRSYMRLQYSINDGVSWSDLSSVNRSYDYVHPNEWERLQADLSTLAGQSIRLRFMTSVSGAPVSLMHLDKVTVAEMPDAVPLVSAVPSLRSVALQWEASTLGADFARYELWRSSSANVSVTNGEKIFESTNVATTTASDTGLNIGGTYYYKVFVVDNRDTFIPSNELSATTVPVSLPLTDSMDATDNWVIGANNAATPTWGITTNNVHEGSGSLAAVPVGQYESSSDTYAETAVDLRDTQWPVLTFWDRFDLNTGDWFRLEISADGGPTEHLYGARETSRNEWRQQKIDLSRWKGLANVRLRFRLITDGGSTPADGWFIDELTVAENPERSTPVTLPFTEGFEANLDQWFPAGWHLEDDTIAIDGTQSIQNIDGTKMGNDTMHTLTLGQPIILPANSNVQVTYWIRGQLSYRSYMRLQYSINDGVSWSDLSSVNRSYDYVHPDEWERLQADLSTLAGQTVRLRFMTSVSGAPVSLMHLDKVTIAEMPDAVPLVSAVPSLRSVALQWDTSTLGADFARYELWRSTSANVSVTNGEKIFESTNVATNTASDTGLNIGGTYYYKVFVVDNRDTFIPSNELSATTVPVSLPLADSMDAIDNWVIGANNAATPTWGITTNNVHEGSGSLAAVPVGQYESSSDTYAETAVDLRDTQWPVLTFWDRYDLSTGDWFRLEISADGGPTEHLYGARETSRNEWRQQRIDLSRWKGLANVRLRFRLITDGGSTPADGWFIDALTVAENPDRSTPVTLPFTEGFEANLDQWFPAGWHLEDDTIAIDGTQSMQNIDGTKMGNDTMHTLTLNQPVILPAGSNVQVTYWIRGQLNYRSYMRLQYSINDGVSWSDLSSVNRSYDYVHPDEWERLQADLSTLAGQTVRLRFMTSVSGAPVSLMHLDKVTIAEMPDAAVAQPIDQIVVTSLRINWIPSTLPTFSRYRIYRSSTNNVSTDSLLITEIEDSTANSFTDTNLESKVTYYYKIFVVDNRDTHSPSDTVSATTQGLSIPLANDFDSPLEGWTVTGNWQILEDVGRDGGKALVDSAGDYLPSSDTSAKFAVDISGMNWPVLKFWDKHAFAGNSWGRVEFSTDGNSWGNYLYGVTGTRTEWHEQAIDLSQFKGQDRLFIRFHRATDGNIADGWTIDDLSISENTNPPAYPIWDGFESDSGLWLKSRWSTVQDIPKEGGVCLEDTPEGRYAPDSQNQLVLAHELDLTDAVDPTLSFYLRGNLVYRSYFRVNVSVDKGLNWTDISTLNRSYDYTAGEEWEFMQASLSPWIGERIRIRIVTSASGQPASSIFIDNIGIGEPAPAAPTPVSPIANESVDVSRPTLTVANAIDYQSDALTYQFEVYSDENLTNLVAQVPAVASGSVETVWTVDVNLPNNGTFWWRARTSDGQDNSPWTEPLVFFINVLNNAPNEVTLVGPPNASVLYDSDEWLIWETASDPDVNDSILDYTLQIDNDADFSSPLMTIDNLSTPPSLPDEAGLLIGLPLADISGAEALTAGRWYWRVRARDFGYLEGPWSTTPLAFRIASDYEHWLLAEYSVQDQDNPAVSGIAADPDHDGIPLMMEYACAMATDVASTEGSPELILVELDGVLHLGFEFDRLIGTDLVFTLKASADLVNWVDSGAEVEVLSTIDSETEHCRIVDPVPSANGRQLRLEIALP